MKKWKIAIVGAGYMALEHAKAFASFENIEIVGVYSRTLSRAQELASRFDAPAYRSISDMYNHSQADVVVVAVNELSMLEVCKECFNFPWICLLEKPVGVDLAEAEKILIAATEAKTKAFVALNRRSYSSTRQAIQKLQQHEGVRLISITDQEDMVAARESGQPERVVRNFMYANSIHLIDYLSLFGRGEIVRVESTVPWNPEKPGFVVSTIHFSSGDIGVYQAIWDGPGPWTVVVTNSGIRVELRPLEFLAVQYRGERKLSQIETDEIDRDFKPGLHYQAQQIIGVLNGQSTDLASINDAVSSMRLCADIYGLR